MNQVAIIGLGLMGGSLGLALKRRGGVAVHGFTRSAETGAKARARGAVDVLHPSLADAVREAGLVVYCSPILRIPDLVQQSRDALRSGTLLTDVGSTKAWLHDAIAPGLAGSGVTFVGSHPICGSEQTGMDAAREDLYDGAVVVVTPGPDTPEGPVDALTDFWAGVGASPIVTDPERHDRLVARTSHLPHMASTLLALAAGRVSEADLARFCGSGYRDTTRLAGGSPEIWQDILLSNRAPVLDELRAYARELDRLIERLDKGDADGLQDILERGRTARRNTLYG